MCESPPEWQETLQNVMTGGLREDLRVGSVIGTLRANDPERGTIGYTGGGDTFTVDELSGTVRLKAALDYERQKYIPVEFTAQDTSGQKIVAAYTVRVLDVNDNSPIFDSSTYQAYVYEGDTAGTLVFDGVVARDKDSGKNSELNLLCYEPTSAGGACRMFDILPQQYGPGVYRGIIRLKESIDSSMSQRYTMVIRAEDRGEDRKYAQATVNINVRPLSEAPPRLLNTPLTFTVFENQAVDSIVGELEAAYQSSLNSNPIRIEIANDPQGYFKMDSLPMAQRESVFSTRIRMARTMDREQLGSAYFFTVRAVDTLRPGRFSIATVGVNIGDDNDHGPVFDQQVYKLSIYEGMPNGVTVSGLNMVVTDEDQESNARCQISIQEATFFTFRLVPLNGTGTTSVRLVVDEARYLDYEVEEYRLQKLVVLARETDTSEARSGSATVSINLLDTNDNKPKFSQSEYKADIREDRQAGYSVTQITASDPDGGNYGRIRYSLIEGGQYFAIDKDGVITLRRQLSYSSEPQVRARIRAEDGGGLFDDTSLVVTVRRYDNRGPEFEKDRYEAVVDEDSMILVPAIQVKAKFPEGSQYRVQYNIQDGNFNGAFRIEPGSGVLTLTRIITIADTGGTGYFNLVIRASDNGNEPSNTVPVRITLRDANNHPPRFAILVVPVTLNENSPPGTPVTTVMATDGDQGINAEFDYKILAGGSDKFEINPKSGLIRVAPSADLDIEKYGSEYSVVVGAIDKGVPPLTGTATVSITVVDTNNKPPRFSQDIYVGSILETQPWGSSVLTVHADDPDTSSRIQYSVDGDSYEARDPAGRPFYDKNSWDYTSAFTVEATSGVISTITKLDYDRVAEVSFRVLARDTGSLVVVASQVATATVTIHIQSSNISYLVFEPSSKTVNLHEEERLGSVVTALVAKDPRTQQPAQRYMKIPGTDINQYFFVNQTNGEITVVRRVDYETMTVKTVVLQLRAIGESAGVTRTAVGTVTVNIVDINDQFPIFLENEYQFSIQENSQFGTYVGTVKANDKDTQPEYRTIVYSISGPRSNFFTINPVTGNITVGMQADLDREAQEYYSLLVTATDNPERRGSGEQRANTVQLTIRLLDVNDNDPQFPEREYTFYTVESLPAGIVLGQVQARDPDAGENGRISYSFRENQIYFEVDPRGNIRTGRDLGGTFREEPYILTLIAQDGGTPRRSGDTRVMIYVKEGPTGQQGRPQITYPPRDYMAFNVTEEQRTQIILQVKADNGGSQFPLVFRLLNHPNLNQTDYFAIDMQSGELRTKGPLDHEKTDKYEIVVEVTDTSPSPKGSVRTLYVNVIDIDDNTGGFDQCPEDIKWRNRDTVVVPEDVATGYQVTQVFACDPDGYPNNLIYYHITCGNEGQDSPFRIDRETGIIYTTAPLDREKIGQYRICVYASNNEDVPAGVEDKDGPNVRVINVYVEDVDDNPPIIVRPDGSDYISAYVLTNAQYRSEVYRVYASDPDGDQKFTYSIVSSTFVNREGNTLPADGYFVIDSKTGVLYTNRNDYYQYGSQGYFNVRVRAAGAQKGSEADVRLYVVDPKGRMKWVFRKDPKVVYSNYKNLFRQMKDATKASYTEDELRYHVNFDGSPDRQRSDLCFFLVRDDRVLTGEEALSLISNEASSDVRAVYRNYSVSDVGSCGGQLTTRWWGGWWWPWWVILACALFIFVCAVILIIILFFLPRDWRGPGAHLQWQSVDYHVE